MTFWFCCGNTSDRKRGGSERFRWRVFSLKELNSATNNFNYDNKLGEGDFGNVHWGQLWNGSQHKNLISLRGYCAEGQERLIVYDYMPNFNLFSHLHGPQSAECLLDWNR
ncbi:putative non-specific protein-tyrosine kinase [Medicago truncatula]|uniref:Putative non-specific protein-tyrosine kinase n=1 Tax=Medicago truncatula TaxID=3880 RepID=A0A396HYW4_MEDTR|nr:putative non-specific protein-tyrosine kinase [Medicago truncatula]